jgi:hypothetical protein
LHAIGEVNKIYAKKNNGFFNRAFKGKNIILKSIWDKLEFK